MFTIALRWFSMRLINHCVALPERIICARIKESSFYLHALRATLATFWMAAGKADARPCPDNLLSGEWQRRQPLDRPRQLWCVEPAQVGCIVDIRTELFTFDSCKMAGDQVILPVSFISSHMIEISLGQRIHELRDKAGLSLRKLADHRAFPRLSFRT